MMYDTAPFAYYLAAIILALVLTVFVIMRIAKDLPRRRWRRYAASRERMFDSIDDLTARVERLEYKQYYDEDTPDEQSLPNVLYFGESAVVEYNGEEIELSTYQCERCTNFFILDYVSKKSYCPTCGSKFTGMLHNSAKGHEKK